MYTHLEGAMLDQAYLNKAHLCGAHLERTQLGIARLKGTDLTTTHLEGAYLQAFQLLEADCAISAYLDPDLRAEYDRLKAEQDATPAS